MYRQVFHPDLFEREGSVKGNRLCFKKFLRFSADAHPFALFPVKISVSRKAGRNQGHGGPVRFLYGEHRADGIFIPALFQPDRAAHDSVRAQKVFQTLVDILHRIRHLARLDAVIA